MKKGKNLEGIEEWSASGGKFLKIRMIQPLISFDAMNQGLEIRKIFFN